jgi:hypothetical protein
MCLPSNKKQFCELFFENQHFLKKNRQNLFFEIIIIAQSYLERKIYKTFRKESRTKIKNKKNKN